MYQKKRPLKWAFYTLEDLKPRLRGSVFKGNVTDK
jgi:hypothetical protein